MNKEITIMGIVFILFLMFALYLDFTISKIDNTYQVENYRKNTMKPNKRPSIKTEL